MLSVRTDTVCDSLKRGCERVMLPCSSATAGSTESSLVGRADISISLVGELLLRRVDL